MLSALRVAELREQCDQRGRVRDAGGAEQDTIRHRPAPAPVLRLEQRHHVRVPVPGGSARCVAQPSFDDEPDALITRDRPVVEVVDSQLKAM